MASLTRPIGREARPVRRRPRGDGAVRDSLIVTLGGQLERALGTITALMLRWGLDPAQLGVYTGLRLYLDNTNRSSLGVGLGAIQEIPILRAAGREDEARRVADVAHTTNTLTCLAYALGLVAWAGLRAPIGGRRPEGRRVDLGPGRRRGAGPPQAVRELPDRRPPGPSGIRADDQAGRLRVAGLDRRRRARALPWPGSGACWGRSGSSSASKIAYLHARHPLRFRWAWDTPTVARLMKVGLPILANTAAFGAVLSLDRVLILWRVPDGDRAAGLYTIAIMGTSWSLDLAGRIVAVMYTYFQSTMGRTRDPRRGRPPGDPGDRGAGPLARGRERRGVPGRPGVPRGR